MRYVILHSIILILMANYSFADIIDVRTFKNISSAIMSPKTASKTILITDRQIINNLTIPADRNLKFEKGGLLFVNKGKKLTIYGQVSAGSFRIFDGSGTVAGLTFVKPEWFGASGDDSTNNAKATNAAIAALQAGGKLAFGAGTYRYASPANINKSIKVTGTNTVLMNTVVRGAILNVTGNDVDISGIIFDSNAGSTAYDRGKGVNITGSNVSVRKCKLTNNLSYGVLQNVQSGNSGLHISDNVFEGGKDRGISLDNLLLNGPVKSGAIISRNIFGKTGNSINLAYVSDVTIDGNTFSGNTGTTINSRDYSVDRGYIAQNVTITNNTFNRPDNITGAMNIELQHADGVVIDNNKFIDSVQTSVQIDHSEIGGLYYNRNVKITNNYFRKGDERSNNDKALGFMIGLNSVYDFYIADNKFEYNRSGNTSRKDSAILCMNCVHGKIFNNMIDGKNLSHPSDSSRYLGVPINIDGMSSDIIVEKNTVINCDPRFTPARWGAKYR